MARAPDELLREALQLPVTARAALAGSLLDSLDQEVDEDAEEAWRKEIRRRLDEIDSGAVEPIPWPEARRRIAGERPNSRIWLFIQKRWRRPGLHLNGTAKSRAS